MKRNLTLFVMLSLLTGAYSQTGSVLAVKRFFELQQLTGQRYMDAGHLNIGMYLYDDWCPGWVILDTGDTIGDLVLHYNAYQDNIVWLRNKTDQITLDSKNIAGFGIMYQGKEHPFKKLKIRTPQDSIETFAEIAFEGNVGMYVIRKNKPETQTIKNNIPYYNYAPRPQYVILMSHKTIILKNRRPRTLYIALPEEEDQIRERLHVSKLNTRSEPAFFSFIKSISDILLKENRQ